VAGLSLLVALAGVTTYALVRDPPYVAPPPRSAAPQARPAQAAVALHALVAALEAGDAEAAAGLAPDDDPAAADLLRAVAGNAADLGLVVDLRYVDETGAVDPDGSWSAAVAATWRYAADHASARAELTVGFRPVTAEAVAVTGFGGTAATRVPVWLAGPATVRDAGGVEVVVSGTGASADSAVTRYLRLAERAVVVVHRVLPDWQANLVVEVPASGAALDRALGSEPGHYRSIAAVTATVDGSSAGEAPVHVFVNPDIFDRLRTTGAQVVVSHEVVHVATDAARSSVPLWLLEGFADYVALRHVDLPITTTAGQIIRQVRREGVPEALPGPAEFDTATTHLGATYESAWLACVLLADLGGQRALVGLYDDVTSGRPLADVLDRRFGLSEAELTRRWQRRLADLAG
jgi:hypothetical protein